MVRVQPKLPEEVEDAEKNGSKQALGGIGAIKFVVVYAAPVVVKPNSRIGRYIISDTDPVTREVASVID